MGFKFNIFVLVLFSGLLVGGVEVDAQGGSGMPPSHTVSRPEVPSDAEMAKLRAEMIEKIKESRAALEKLLAIHQENASKLANDYQRRRKLLEQDLISKAELREVELAHAKSVNEMERVKRRILEDDTAITEATMRDELMRLPTSAVGRYSENGILARFDGGGLWSLAQAPKIENFFQQTFGRALPITAFGQTTTHDRLKLDHRNALDVALHPDSSEGRSLLSYLRQGGIPFIAFRGAVTGASTGAHIHIGRPSSRN